MCQPCLFGDILGTNAHIIIFERRYSEGNPNYTFASFIGSIAEYGTRYVIIDIQAPSFTRVNSLHPQSQCLAITAFCKAPQRTSKICPLGDHREVSYRV